MDCAHVFKRGRLFMPKIWFTAYYGALGIIMPYFNVLLAHMGYGARQIGVISILRPLVSGVSGPLLSSTADALSAHRKMFLIALALTSMIRVSLGVLATPFTYLISIITIMEISNGPLSALSDSAVMSATREAGDYGFCRFWASVAYNITGIMSSAAMSFAGDTAVFIGYAFGAAAAFVTACHLSFDKVSRPHRPEADPESPQARLISHQHSSSGVSGPQVALMDALDAVAGDSAAPHEPLLADCPLYNKIEDLEEGMHGNNDAGEEAQTLDGTRIRASRPESFWQKLGKVCVGVIDGFLFVYMDQLGAPPALLGACLLMIGCAELPIFQYSGQILSFLGYSRALHLALGAFCCRLAVYSTMHVMPTLWMVAPFEALHGITFGIAWAAGVNFCQAKAPEGLKSTIQSLFGATYYGLGRGVGGLVGGLMLHHFGGPILFRSVLIWTAGSWGVIGIMEALTTSTSSTPST